MLLQSTAMALAESAIEVSYKGKKGFASIIIDADGGANYVPLVQLGVSDTDQATAQSNVVTIFTGTSASTLDDLVVAIKNASGGTVGADTEISRDDFDCRVKDAYATMSIYDVSAAEFNNEAGATNLKATWVGTLIRHNDVAGCGYVMKRVAPPAMGKGNVALVEINGVTCKDSSETQLTGGVTRTILNDAGETLWTVTMATPTKAGLRFIYGEGQPVQFNGPIIVKDEPVDAATYYADVDYTNTFIVWGLAGNCGK